MMEVMMATTYDYRGNKKTKSMGKDENSNCNKVQSVISTDSHIYPQDLFVPGVIAAAIASTNMYLWTKDDEKEQSMFILVYNCIFAASVVLSKIYHKSKGGSWWWWALVLGLPSWLYLCMLCAYQLFVNGVSSVEIESAHGVFSYIIELFLLYLVWIIVGVMLAGTLFVAGMFLVMCLGICRGGTYGRCLSICGLVIIMLFFFLPSSDFNFKVAYRSSSKDYSSPETTNFKQKLGTS
mmetsp:Transcript_5708/g.7522  ORF Transcript_5708/g.7522 Transcript_5708/m.7522 type:complete len:237 (-) Transcript_5708:366-1076(-)